MISNLSLRLHERISVKKIHRHLYVEHDESCSDFAVVVFEVWDSYIRITFVE